MAKTKIDFQELARFLDSDYTLSFIPDIVYPPEYHVYKVKMSWLAERLETTYNRFLENKPTEESEEITLPEDEE
jgi:hypothetical protein